MSLLPNATNVNLDTYFFLRGTGQSLNLSSLQANSISTNVLNAGYINNSTINTLTLDLDGQVLTATPTELLLNGIPVATQSSLSTIADWSLDPAISTVNMANNNLISTNNISTNNIVGGNAMFGNLVAYNALFVSTATSTISSMIVTADVMGTSSFGAASGQFSTLTINSLLNPTNGILLPLDATNATGGILFGLSTSSNFYDQYNGLTTSYVQLYNNTQQLGVGFVKTVDAEANYTFGDFFTGRMSVAGDQIGYGSEKAPILDADASGTLYLGASAVSTAALQVSSINGSEFSQNAIQISSLITAQISTQLTLMSSLQFNPGFNLGGVNLGLGSLFGNLGGAALGGLGVLVGGAALGTGIAALTNGRQTSNLNSTVYELVNGTTQLQISTLGDYTSTIFRFTDSAQPNVIPGPEIFVSTINPPGSVCIRSISDPLNTVSSPTSTIQAYGQWTALPAVATPSTFTDLNCLELNLLSNASARCGAPLNNSPAALSSFEVFNTGAPQYSAPLRANQINFSYAGLTSNDYTNDTLLYNYTGGAPADVRLAVSGAGMAAKQIAYTADFKPSLTTSTIDAYQMLNVSSINGQPISFYEPGGVSTVSTFQDLYTSSFVASTFTSLIGSVSSLTDVSTINGAVYPPPQTQLVSSFVDVTTSTLAVSSIGASSGNPIYMTNDLWFSTSQSLDGGGGGSGTDGADLTNWREGYMGTVYTDSVKLLGAAALTVDPIYAVNTSSIGASTITMPSTGILQGSIGVGVGTVLSSFQSVETLNLKTDTLNGYVTGNILVGTNIAGADGIVAQFSTLVADELVSTQKLEVSSLNGYAWSNITSLNQTATYVVTAGNQACWVGGGTSQGASTFLSTGTYYSLGQLATNLTDVVRALGGAFTAFEATAVGNQLNISSIAGATDFGISFAVIPPSPPPFWNANPFSGAAIQSNADLLGGVYGSVYGGAGATGNAGLLPNPAGITNPIFGSEMTFSTVQVADFVNTQKASISSATISSINGGVALLDSKTGTLSSLTVSTVVGEFAAFSTIFAGALSGTSPLASQLTNFSTIQGERSIFSTMQMAGPSSITFTTPAAAGAGGQPAGRLLISGNDVDIGQNDLWAQQIRLGYANPGGSAQAELIFYDPAGTTTRALNLGGSDRTIRIQSTINSGTAGYLLDTQLNPPIFSTINGTTSTAMFAYFPSTNLGSIGYSTVNILPSLNVAGSFLSRSTQTVTANTPLTLWHEVNGAGVGGLTTSTNTIVIPSAGLYEIATSIQFDKTGGGITVADFWFRKNGVDIPDSGSQIAVAGQDGETLGNVILLEQCAANDKIEVVIASADATLGATFFQSTVTTPYTRPAIPSVITNLKRVG